MSHDLANLNWDCSDGHGRSRSVEHATLAVLMDLRLELQRLNRVIGCGNAIDIPNILRRIETNTKPKVRRRKR